MRALFVLISLLLTPLAIAQQISGPLFDSGKFWNIRDAIAVRGERGIEIYLTEGYFDRFAFAADGKIESRDLRLHSRERIEFDLTADGNFRHFDSSGFPEQEAQREPEAGWQLIEVNEARIKARWNYGQSNFMIDLAIEASVDANLGAPIGPDSAPVKALLSYLSARVKGDGETVLALARLPEDLAEMTPESRAEFIKGVVDTKRLAKTEVVVSGGRILGAIAEVKYSGKSLTGKPNARAFMVEVNKKWVVQGIGD